MFIKEYELYTSSYKTNCKNRINIYCTLKESKKKQIKETQHVQFPVFFLKLTHISLEFLFPPLNFLKHPFFLQ